MKRSGSRLKDDRGARARTRARWWGGRGRAPSSGSAGPRSSSSPGNSSTAAPS